MARRTLLLCFIHGFKGGDDTFARFPEHLKALISHALPALDIRTAIYPKYQTRGELQACVASFRDWLQNLVIDIECAAGTPSPTVDPSVRVILIGHSMGGIVAADTLIAILDEEAIKTAQTTEPLPSSSGTTAASSTSTSVPAQAKSSSTNPDSSPSQNADSPHFMFPYIQGILAFDTPYLGIAPTVLAYGAESHYQTASTAYSALSSAASAFGFGSSQSSAAASSAAARTAATRGLPAAGAAESSASSWSRWGKYAMVAGAAGAVAAGGAAAYRGRDTLGQGWSWTGEHLAFVGCLIRGEDLKQRVARLVSIRNARSIGILDLYTVLGKGAGTGPAGISLTSITMQLGSKVTGSSSNNNNNDDNGERTFCNLPTRDAWRDLFMPAKNDRAGDEVGAHMHMFEAKENPGYHSLCETARDAVVGWVDKGWYAASESTTLVHEHRV